MIISMQKYSFLIYHADYEDFLKKLQEIGVLHAIEKEVDQSDDIATRLVKLSQYDKTIKLLKSREVEPKDTPKYEDGKALFDKLLEKQEEREHLNLALANQKKELTKVEPWGDFSMQKVEDLQKYGITVKFFVTSKKRFETLDPGDEFTVEKISEEGNFVYFLVFGKTDSDFGTIEADEVPPIKHTLGNIKKEIATIQEKIKKIEQFFDDCAATSLDLLEQTRNRVKETADFYKVRDLSETEAEGKVKLLEGWVPVTKEEEVTKFLDDHEVVYVSQKPDQKDKVPILLHNNRFSRLFEPIGKLFSLPDYHELDLTVFFAPFFMMFFGFCLGDAGYGLLFLIGAGIYKLKAKESFKPLLSLAQWLGLATVIFGLLSGTFFGINLIETEIPFLTGYQDLFFNPDKMFNLALVVGFIQIVFGLIVKTANQMKQNGWVYGLSSIGWIIVLLGSVMYVLLTNIGILPSNKVMLYIILGIGGFFILFFSNPKANIFSRIGTGIWDIYSTVTGVFGDLLSYIRLFALGLSSAILGFVINDIGIQILGSAPIIGPIFFVIFLLLGHTLNILISSLGSFVHPMRLTFVEFYKNAGFKGGGKAYRPFAKQKDQE
jgi:V/A-type H+/Na+-transporting ATPase subunit I